MSAIGTRLTQLRVRLRRAIGPLHRARHHRTLRRGMADAVTARLEQGTWWGDDDRWFPGSTPPRFANRVTPLIDGEDFFAVLHEALAHAQRYIYISGWSLTPRIPLLRRTEDDLIQSQLLGLLTEAARRIPVRVLLWNGAPVMLQPTKRTMEAVQCVFAERVAGDLQCALDDSARLGYCHHQKVVIVDGQVAFVGGMDLTTLGGDRWDTQEHLLRHGPNWHDVQVRIEGEAVADVERTFRQRWQATTGDGDLPQCEPVCDQAWQTPVQIVRTIAKDTYPFAPHGEFGIYHAYIHAIRRARRFIYLENQYLWSPDIVDALIAAMNRQHTHPFRIVIVLPAQANDGKWDNDRHVERLRDVDDGRGIVSVYSLYASGPGIGRHPFTYRPIYLHAKVGIIDDEWLTVGSANLNNRGLIHDSQVNAVMCDSDLARDVRIRLWAE
ncbi:MAG: phospholipase D family protein, partial [Chloroflexota bacterium]|nr:phospholipase D family protein [Chloroflexota bacterium]